ncbi:hypothetical protein [Kitasatospora sp. NPDC090091]|uniref:hypothetical protein n=1 Tax=Kitasatospora sp. NPDC090091 TaxID=3364081 RepID=UPI0037FBF942
MIPWPVDVLLGVLLLVLEAGAALRYVVKVALAQWHWSTGGLPRSKDPTPAPVVAVVPVALPAALGAGLLWAGLPVSAGIQFAVPGVLVLLLAILMWKGAAKKRRDERDRAAAAARDSAMDGPPPGSIVVPLRWDPDERRYSATLEGFPFRPGSPGGSAGDAPDEGSALPTDQ